MTRWWRLCGGQGRVGAGVGRDGWVGWGGVGWGAWVGGVRVWRGSECGRACVGYYFGVGCDDVWGRTGKQARGEQWASCRGGQRQRQQRRRAAF